MAYHHGDLRSALVEAAVDLVAEQGLGALSVAAVARRSGVSAAAPYRHFSGRDALLAATAARTADELTVALKAALGGVDDPVQVVGVTAEVYVRFVVGRRAGLDLVFANELRALADPNLATAGRALMDVLLPVGTNVTGDAATAVILLERVTASAHGYAHLHLSGFLHHRGTDVDAVAASAAETARQLAHQTLAASNASAINERGRDGARASAGDTWQTQPVLPESGPARTPASSPLPPTARG